MKPLEKIIIEPKSTATHAVLWLHGLGADGHDFEPLVPELNLPSTRFIFPHAPMQKVTLNAGMTMRAWFDIYGLSIDVPEDEAGIRQSQALVEQLIEEQIALGISPEKILLVGFSQGAAMALHTGLRYSKPLAGIIALSAYLPLHKKIAHEYDLVQKNTPLFMAHGLHDMVLPLALGSASKKYLEQLGLSVEWHDYPMDHAICPEEIIHLREFIEKQRG